MSKINVPLSSYIFVDPYNITDPNVNYCKIKVYLNNFDVFETEKLIAKLINELILNEWQLIQIIKDDNSEYYYLSRIPKIKNNENIEKPKKKIIL